MNQSLWLLSVMMRIAQEKMVIAENPFAALTVLRKGLLLPVPRRRLNVPSRSDMVRIIAELRRVPEGSGNPLAFVRRQQVADESADHIELLAYSGMRRNEARASTVGDDRGDEFKIWGTKSETSERTIPVNPALRSVLDRIKSRRIGARTKLCLLGTPSEALHGACDRLSLPRLRIHDLRHFFASACIASGVDVPTVSRWLGHADGGALCMKTYGHLLKDASMAAAQRVDFSGSGSAALARTG